MEAAMVGVSFVRIAVGVVLLTAGLSKLQGGEQRFTAVVARYELVPAGVAPVLGRWLPWAEVVAGVFLATGIATRPAAIAAALLFTVFSVAIGVGLARGRTHDCGCSGVLGGRLRWRLMHRNLALTLALLPVYAFGGGSLDAGLIALLSLAAAAAVGTFGLQGVITANQKGVSA